MFRDREEELNRLASELLAEEAEDKEALAEPDWDDVWDDDMDELPEYDGGQSDHSDIYKNYANDYGQTPQIYNSDRTDEDPEELSRALETPADSGNRRLLIFLTCLLIAIAAIMIYWIVHFS